MRFHRSPAFFCSRSGIFAGPGVILLVLCLAAGCGVPEKKTGGVALADSVTGANSDTIPGEKFGLVGDLYELGPPGLPAEAPAPAVEVYHAGPATTHSTAAGASRALALWESKGVEARVIFPENASEAVFRISFFESPDERVCRDFAEEWKRSGGINLKIWVERRKN